MKEAHRHCGMRGAFGYRLEFIFCLRPAQNSATRAVSVNKIVLVCARFAAPIQSVSFNNHLSSRAYTQPHEWCAADTNGLCQFIFASTKWKSIDCIDTNNLRKPSAIADKWCASSQWSAVVHVLHTECIRSSCRGDRIVDSNGKCEWIIMINYNVKPIICSAIMKWKRHSTIPHAANGRSRSHAWTEKETGVRNINLVTLVQCWRLRTTLRTNYIIVRNLLIRPTVVIAVAV